MVGYRAGEKGFAGSGGTVEEDAFRLRDTERFEEFGVFEAELNHFFDLFDLLVQTTNHVVGAVGDLFDHHEGDEGIDLAGC